ncbi:WD40 repeat-like protein [Phlegmacium glaucopus]|nr:WD40 repeat-like protein [Phlegmacium glaucopus]
MHIVSASDDCTARIWGIATGECEAELKGHSLRLMSAVFSPDGMHVVSASDDCTARIWNTATGECETELKGHLKRVRYAVFSPDGMYIVSASDDHTVRIWNMATGNCEAELKGHSDWVRSAVFSSDVPVFPSIPDNVFTHSYFDRKDDVSSKPSFLEIYTDTVFHTVNLHKIWIPPPFRKPSSISCHSSKICLGYTSGELLLLETIILFVTHTSSI